MRWALPYDSKGYFGNPDEARMTYNQHVYIGLSRMSSINFWARTDYGQKGGFRNKMGVFADATFWVGSRVKTILPTPGTLNPTLSDRFGFRAGLVYDGVSDSRNPNLGFLALKLESGWIQGGFYLGLSTGLSFDIRTKKEPK
jgi:hypothetical protein